jgi:hypothetical protein
VTQFAEETSPWENSSQIAQESHRALHGDGVDKCVTPDHEQTQAASGLLHLNSASAYEDESRNISRNSVSNYAISTECESGDATYTAETPPDAAFSRWFGLLVRDADYEVGGMPKAIDDFVEPQPLTSNLGRQVQSLCVAPSDLHGRGYLSRENRRSRAERLSVSDSSYGSPSLPYANRILGKPLWRGSEPSKLSMPEQTLLENFVRNVSSWVAAPNKPLDGAS